MKEHVPVMVNEVLEALRPWEEVGTVVDATLGLGGTADIFSGIAQTPTL